MTIKLHGIEACVFDAYGTLFNVNSAARNAEDSLREKWQPLAELWRTKQLQYTWLRCVTDRHAGTTTFCYMSIENKVLLGFVWQKRLSPSSQINVERRRHVLPSPLPL